MIFHRKIYLSLRHRRVRKFLSGTRNAAKTQRDVLFSKLRANASSAFGRDHGFSKIQSIEDFRRQIPLNTYDYYRSYVDRVKQGETTAMFGADTKLLMFAMTSGTTAQSKFIPVTDQFMREYRYGWNLWGLQTYWDYRRMLGQFTVQLSSDWQEQFTDGGIPCGSISGLAATTNPRISRPMFIVPPALMKIKHTESKQYAALRLTMTQPNVGMMVTANPSTLVEFSRLADRRRESLIRDIFDGTLSDDAAVPAAVRDELQQRIARRDTRRARELERIVDETGTLYPRDFWPNMSVLAVWTGGSVGSYLPRVRQYFGDVPFRDHGLSASEGRMTIPLHDGTSAGILDYVTMYFEFIPEDEHDSEHPTVLEAHELEEGQNYFIVLTTSSGFYRYDIHDVVRCVGFEGQAPRLEFVNKGSHFSSITGEKLSEMQGCLAVKNAFAELGYDIEWFTIAAKWGDPPGYSLILEPGAYSGDHERLCRCVDKHLSAANCEYENRLQTRRLRPLEYQEVPHGTWMAVRDKRLEEHGGTVEQYKHRFLTSDTKFAASLRHLNLPQLT